MTKTQNKVEFLKEWTPDQFKYVEKSIAKFIHSRYWESHHSPDADPFIKARARSFNQISDILGFAYTSSSDCAGYWPCNDYLYLDNDKHYKLIGFAHDKNGLTHAIFWNAEENEISFPI